MTAAGAPRRSLGRRIMWAFAAQALLVCAVFTVLGFVLVYSLEDAFFSRMLREEVQRQQASAAQKGHWATPQRDFMQVHVLPQTFPADLRSEFDRRPQGREFFGQEGRHYHLAPLHAPGVAPAWLVAEVSAYLVVRPARPGILKFMGLATALVFVLACVAGAWLARRALAPLARLAASIRAAPQGLLPAGFSARYANDEIGLLAQALEQAMLRIEAFIEREQRFTSDASHELRTPLTVVAGAAELLAARGDLPVDARKPLERIRQACRQMEQTVNTLLSLAREGQNQPAAQQLDLHAIVEEVLQVQGRAYGNTSLVVENRVPAGVTVWAPAPVLALVLGNLVGNALQHTHQGRVRIEWDDGALVIADEGPGIEPEVLPRLYEPHVKGSRSAGFGLGLSIVRRLCERHHLALLIDTPPEGGTRAVLRLPRAG